MIKKAIGSIIMLFSIGTFAQQSTSSAYSYYGIGEIKFKGAVENRSMGGVSIFGDSIHINLQNPASYAGLKRTTFTIAGSYNTTDFITNTETGKARRTGLDYLAMGFPITKKLGVGFGLLPYSTVGYQLQKRNLDIGGMNDIHTGEGGVNKTFISLAYQVNEHLSVGATFNYNFGSIETSSVSMITGTQYGTRELNNSKISGANLNFGAMWNKKMNDKNTLFAAVNFAPESKLVIRNERNLSVFEYSNSGNQIVKDEQDLDVADSNIKTPTTFSAGVGYGQNRKWLVGSEYTILDYSNFGNRNSDITNATFGMGSRLSVGGYFIPKYNSYTNYLARITYRAGVKFENTGLSLENAALGKTKDIKDTALTLGLSFPISGSFTRLNVGMEYGKRGTKDANFVEEKYTNFTLSLSFSDLWFVKRKYN